MFLTPISHEEYHGFYLKVSHLAIFIFHKTCEVFYWRSQSRLGRTFSPLDDFVVTTLTHFWGFHVRPWPCNDEDAGGLFSQVSQSGTIRIINLFVIPCSPKVKTEYVYCRSGYTEDTSQSQIKQKKKKVFILYPWSNWLAFQEQLITEQLESVCLLL